MSTRVPPSSKQTPTGKQGKPEPPKPVEKPTGKAAQQPPSKPVASAYTGSGFDASKYTRPGLSADDIQRIKECFDIFDYDKSGAITPNELKNAIIALGLQKSAEEILNLVEDLDRDGNNEVEFEEFLQIFGFTGDITDEEVLKDLFDQFDSEKRGLVSVEDFQRINDLVGERYSASELHEMVEYADKDKDGLINWEEFKTVVQKQFGGQA